MKANEKSQRQYDIIMLQIREMIFNDNGGLEMVLDQVKSVEGGPAKGIGYTAAMMVKSIKGGLEEKGKKVSPEILQSAFMETVAELTEIAIAAKLVPADQKQAIAKQAATQGAQIFKASMSKPKEPPQSPRSPMPGQPQAQPGIVQQQMGAQA